VGRVWEKLFALTYSRELVKRGWSRTGLLGASAAIDADLYDIMSKSAGQPLYKFLGGYRAGVPAYVTGGYYREGQGIPELVKEVEGYLKQGYNAIKLKVGGISGGYTIEADYQRVKAVRDAVGPKVKLMLDANQGWDVSTAIQASNKMYDLDITWPLLASVPNGDILEASANPERDPLWFELYTRRPRIEKSVLYLDNIPGLGIEFDQRTLDRFGTKLV